MEPGDIETGKDLEEIEGALEPGDDSGVLLEREKHEKVESKLQEVAAQLKFLHEEIGPKD